MFGFDEARDNYDRVQNDQPDHEGKFSHEMIGGAAAFLAARALQEHQRKEGKPVSHEFAKDLLAGFAGAEVDKLAETKGEDWFDKERSKHEAKKRAENLYDQHYGQYEHFDPSNQEAPRQYDQY